MPTRLEDRRLGALIEEIFKRNRRRYGYRRIAQELKDHDIVCAPAKLCRLMRQRGLRAIQAKNYLPNTNDDRADRLFANLLAQQALQGRPQARSQHTLFHSDRGCQYGSSSFRAVLAGTGMRQSMWAKANPYNKAWTESFMGSLKREMLKGGGFEDAIDAQFELIEYIDGYYNSQRKHSAIG